MADPSGDGRLGATAAVVAAAGRSERAGDADIAKQFRSLGDRPMVGWCIEALARAGCDPIVVAVPDGTPSALIDGLVRYASRRDGARSEVSFVTGGGTRQISVFEALRTVGDRDRVVVHDAARPLVTVALIEAVVAALDGCDGAVAALPVNETLKRVRDRTVVGTVDRSDLWQVQTPQAFDRRTLAAAHERARVEGLEGTDDAQIVEVCGGSVSVVEGMASNIKVTYESDLELARALLELRR